MTHLSPLGNIPIETKMSQEAITEAQFRTMSYAMATSRLKMKLRRLKADLRIKQEVVHLDPSTIDRAGILRLLSQKPSLQAAVDAEDHEILRTGRYQPEVWASYITAEEVDELFSSDDDISAAALAFHLQPQHPYSVADDFGGETDTAAHSSHEVEGPLKKKRRTRRPKDPNAPKKPQNAYFRYRDQELARLKAVHGNDSSTDLTRLISDNWNQLPSVEKQPYYDAYHREYDEYRTTAKAEKAAGIAEAASSVPAADIPERPLSAEGSAAPRSPGDDDGSLLADPADEEEALGDEEEEGDIELGSDVPDEG
ncbi:non-histone protein [Tieghemiomyces parasiticus]|uniref:Non-histone protein n=1 Tax=Tieghemiomyces parasiticus TaxID=78921 RepID=A0A9W8DZI0_9FUNG|nr:non-histone protein [Tieghemiomyces parasiticus]